MSEPRLGIVAIGRNEGDRLVRCLRSLQGCGYPVVYVDSASTDGSPAAARSLGAQVVALDMGTPFTAARARAAGFAELCRIQPEIDFVFFLDGDCETEPGFIDKAINFLDQNPDAAVVCGRRRERFPEASPYNRLMDQEWDTPVGEAEACGGDAIYRCRPYRAVGGFDTRMLAGEEPELCARLRAAGWTIQRLDLPMTIHDAAMHRFSQWWRRAIRSGMGYAQAFAQTRHCDGGGLYRRHLIRAMVWAGALPAVSVALAIVVEPILAAIWPVLTILRFLRLALRDGTFRALLATMGSYAELAGMLRYYSRAMAGHTGSTVEYK